MNFNFVEIWAIPYTDSTSYYPVMLNIVHYYTL